MSWSIFREQSVAYTAHLLQEARAEPNGVEHRGGLVPWERVEQVFCAEVGEPEGVRTIVFDLTVEIDAGQCVVYRFDADPGPTSAAVGGAIERAVGSGRCTSAVREVAKDGVTSRWFPDIESFEDDNVSALRSFGPR